MNIFGIYLSLALLLIFLLAMNISRLRIQEKVANGDGGNIKIKKATRAHMNTLEHTLPYSLLMYFLYFQGESQSLLTVLCFSFLAIRVLHAYSMLNSRFRIRQITAGSTYILELVAAISVLVISF